MTPFRGPDGTWWGAEIEMTTHSGALVIFHHPDGESARRNRYAWINAHRPEANDPRSRLTENLLQGSLQERELARLFRRSMPIETARPSYIVS
jgi:hypothetical protein